MNWNKINIDKCPYYSKDKNSNNIFDRCKKNVQIPREPQKDSWIWGLRHSLVAKCPVASTEDPVPLWWLTAIHNSSLSKGSKNFF